MARGKGRGWFGDSVGHSKAGRKGGLARSRKIKNNVSEEDNIEYLRDVMSSRE